MKEIVQIEIIVDFINWETTSVKGQLNQNSKNLTMYFNLNICPGNDKNGYKMQSKELTSHCKFSKCQFVYS